MQNFRRAFAYAFSFAIILFSGLAVANRQEIIDWYRLRDYSPSSQIVSLADNTAMTDYGRKLFYVHDPKLEDQAAFNASCTHYEQTIVLGCYITHRSIHIFDVTDERLKGIREVTAAHEMLHAAYDRLSSTDKESINKRINDFYQANKSSLPRIEETVLSYAERDANIVGNELHSILATEVRELPTELEEYYSQYFEDRQQVVALAEQYESVFVEQQESIKILAEQIQQLEIKLQGKRAELESEVSAINQESNRLAELRDSDPEAYNERVPGYNQRVSSYSSSVRIFNNDIERLNSLIEQHNNLAVEQKELNSAIDSRSQSL